MTGVEIGDLIGPVGSVDPKGTVLPAGGGWVVEWGIGAEDRWHLASAEAAVRQSLLDDAPVPVTAMRIPGGDIVHRVTCLNDGSGRAISLEVENQSGTPVSLALAVRPSGTAPVQEVVVTERGIAVDGKDALVVDRPSGGSVAADAGDVWSSVVDGPDPGDRMFASSTGTAAGALVVPLPHRQFAHAFLPISGPLPEPVPASVVAAGWRAVAGRAATVEVGDPAFVAQWRREVPALVLAAGSDDIGRAARAACLLDRIGLPDEADRARATLVAALEEGRVPAPTLAPVAMALASRWVLAGRGSGLADLVALVVGPGLTADQIDRVAAALDQEDRRAANDVRRLPPAPSADGAESTGLTALLDSVVVESPSGIDLLPRPGRSWVAGPIDIRNLVTRHGTVSYSVRWHDDRPALLWQVESTGSVRLTSTGLDPAWSTAEPEGEALLSPSVR